MIIAFILFVWLILRLHHLSFDSREKKRVVISMTIISLIVAISLILFQGELYLKGFYNAPYNGTYGSDATVYYETALNILRGRIPISLILREHAGGYYLWDALIEWSSPWVSILWIKLCNILIFIHLLFSIYLILRKNSVSLNNSLLIVTLIAINGGLMWTAIRNLKDILLCFLIVEGILEWENFLNKRKSFTTVLKLIVLLTMISFAVKTLRTFAVFIILMISIYYSWKIPKYRVKKFMLVSGIVLIGLVLVLYLYPPQVVMHEYKIDTQYVLANMQAKSYVYMPFIKENNAFMRIGMGGFTIIFFPVPFRYIRLLNFNSSSTIFMGFSDNFWKLECSLLWWLLLPFFIMGIFTKKFWKNRFFIAFGIWSISYILVYGYMYAGFAGEIRQKVPLYIWGTGVAVMKMSELGVKKTMAWGSAIGLLLFFGGLLWTFH